MRVKRSLPLAGASVATLLVAVPAMFAIAQPSAAGAAGTTAAGAAVSGTLTAGAGDSGFTWAAAGGDTGEEVRAASGAVIPVEDGAAGLRIDAGGEPATEQPRPFVLRGLSAHVVGADGNLGREAMGRPSVEVDARTDATGAEAPARRLADLGAVNATSPAFDVDHTIDTTWTFDLDDREVEALRESDVVGTVFCAAVESGGVVSDGPLPGSTGMDTVITFFEPVDEGDQAPEPTFTADVPTTEPGEPAPTFTADVPTVEPEEPRDPRPTATPAPAPQETCAEAFADDEGLQPEPLEPLEAAGFADEDADDDAGWSSRFTPGSTQDDIVLEDEVDGQPIYRVDGNSSGEAMTGAGLDLAGAEGGTYALAFDLVAAPDDGAAVYRNHTAHGAFADAGHAQQELREQEEDSVAYRRGPTRDAHATWSFTQEGAYCVAYAVQDRSVRAHSTAGAAPQGVLTFLVGDVEADAVDCREESADAGIDFPPGGEGPDEDAGGDDGVDDGSDEEADGEADGGLEDRSDEEADGDEGIDGREDGEGVPGREEDDEDDDDEDDTRVIVAPATAQVCPAGGDAPRQVRGGDHTLDVTEAGLTLADDATQLAVAAGSTVVVGDTSRRGAPAGIDGFVGPGGEYLATGSSTAPGFSWSAANAEDAVDLTVEQTEGTGQAHVFMTETGSGMSGGETVTVEPGGSGGMVFGFDQPGEYTVALAAGGGEQVELQFAVGDRFASARPGVTTLALFDQCADASLATDLADPVAASATENGDNSAQAQQQRTASGLGPVWWGVGGVGMGLAVTLLVAILVVVLRETRR